MYTLVDCLVFKERGLLMADGGKNAKEVKKNIFVRMWKGFTGFFKNIFLELKKVTWPTKKKVLANTVSVLLFCAIVGAIIWLADAGLTAFLKLLNGLR